MGVLLVWMARGAYLDMLRRMVPDLQEGSLLPALLTAGGLFLLVSVLNVLPCGGRWSLSGERNESNNLFISKQKLTDEKVEP